MIFNNNTTSLGAYDVPVLEGYDASCGPALALIESARNDYEMFKAMLEVDARECAIRRESSDYVNEAEIISLSEGAIKGIWESIKRIIGKIMSKIRSIFDSFFSRFAKLMTSDTLVKKYGNSLIKNESSLSDVKIKWRTPNGAAVLFAIPLQSVDEVDTSVWDSDATKRFNNFIKKYRSEVISIKPECSNPSDYRNIVEQYMWEDTEAKEVDASEIGIKFIVNNLDGYKKSMDYAKAMVKKANASYAHLMKSAERAANDKNNVDPENAKMIYDIIVIMNDVMMIDCSVFINFQKSFYSQLRAAFTKLVAANRKNLKENTIYLDAVEEAAAQEVEDVICGALSDEELSDLSNASTDVIDSDVSDDPSALTYGPDKYTQSVYYDQVDGYKDSNVNSNNSTEESAFFGQLFY